MGTLDMVVADATQGAVHVLLGDGRGHFGSSDVWNGHRSAGRDKVATSTAMASPTWRWPTDTTTASAFLSGTAAGIWGFKRTVIGSQGQ